MSARPALALAGGTRLGRFELRRELGRGAQATVWLAFDPRLEREVALKLAPEESAVDPFAVGQWLAEARSVSRLTHPNIVPVFEADVYGGRPGLVFEYVPGPTLAQHLRAHGPMAAQRAVSMAIGVLDALAVAHGAGIVHRDLKPSNILFDAAGRARVMDFGIAARLNDPGSRDQVVGTPGYMSPEAVDGGLPTAAMDVFAVGLVLVEWLSGERVVGDRDPYRAMARVVHEDLDLPATLPAAVDDALRSILRRAIERDPACRWADAAAFRDALRLWLAPPAADEPRDPAGGASTLDFLLRRMRHKSDFPALSDALVRIQFAANSESQSVQGLADEILKDVALTQKLLRLANCAQFASAEGGVGTVSRAIALVGFAGIRNLAMNLVLLEHMRDKAHAGLLREQFLRSLFAGTLAADLIATGREAEEAFIGGMFLNLGRMLAEFYFPDEAELVRGLVAGHDQAPPLGEAAASVSVLGLSYEDLGLGIAQSWGLPDSLQSCMRTPRSEPPQGPATAAERLRWASFAANEIGDALLQLEPAQARAGIAEIARRFARVLGLGTTAIEEAVTSARDRLAGMAEAMNLRLEDGSSARRLFLPVPGAAGNRTAATNADRVARPPPSNAVPASSDRPEARPAALASAMLAEGVQRITDACVTDIRLDTLMRMVLETMQRALAFRRVVFCLRDPKTDTLTGRFGVGDEPSAVLEPIVRAFAVPLKAAPDLFSAVCLKGVDTLIADATVASVAPRLPAWFGDVRVGAPTFLLLPMQIHGATIGLIYADKATRGAIDLPERELGLLRTLRNQAVMALRQQQAAPPR